MVWGRSEKSQFSPGDSANHTGLVPEPSQVSLVLADFSVGVVVLAHRMASLQAKGSFSLDGDFGSVPKLTNARLTPRELEPGSFTYNKHVSRLLTLLNWFLVESCTCFILVTFWFPANTAS